jgi:hypothetical protein
VEVDVYGEKAARKPNTEYEVPAGRAVDVFLSVSTSNVGSTPITIEVDKVALPEVVVTASTVVVQRTPITFVVPAGKKWKVVGSAGNITSMESVYAPLG